MEELWPRVREENSRLDGEVMGLELTNLMDGRCWVKEQVQRQEVMDKKELSVAERDCTKGIPLCASQFSQSGPIQSRDPCTPAFLRIQQEPGNCRQVVLTLCFAQKVS